jgi:hypothetical protein
MVTRNEDRDDAADAPRPPTGAPRRFVFRTWVVVTALMMAGAWILGRVIEDDRIGFVFAGVVFPILTAVLLFLGLGWLIYVVRRGPPRHG